MHLSWTLKHTADKYNISNACRSRKLCFSQPEWQQLCCYLKYHWNSAHVQSKGTETQSFQQVSWLRRFSSVMKPLCLVQCRCQTVYMFLSLPFISPREWLAIGSAGTFSDGLWAGNVNDILGIYDISISTTSYWLILDYLSVSIAWLLILYI